MTRFLRLFVITILVCCPFSSIYCRPPPSPCPHVFAYEGEFERDRWYGVISFTSNIELAGLNIKVQLDQPSELLVAWEGEIRSVDNTFYHIFNPFTFQQAGETMKVRIMAKFNPARSPPTIRSIVIDGTTVCASGQSLIPSRDVTGYSAPAAAAQQVPASVTITERIDPSFNSNIDDLTSEYQHKGTQADFDRISGPVNSVQHNQGTQAGMNSGYDADKGVQVDDSHFNRDRIINPSPISTHYDNRGSGIGSGFNQYDRRPQVNSFGTVDDSNIPYNGQLSAAGNQASSGDRPSQWLSENPTSGWSSNSAVSGSNQNSGLSSGANQLSSPSAANSYLSQQYQQSQSGLDMSSNKNPLQQNPSTGGGSIVTTLTIPNHVNDKNINQIVELIKNQLEQQKNSNLPTNGTYIVALVNPIPSNLESTINSAANSVNATQHFSSTANAAVQNPAASPTAVTNRHHSASSIPKVQKVTNSATTTPRNRHSVQV